MSSQSLCGYEMKRFIILACLVAAQFAHGAHVKTIWHKLDGRSIRLPLEDLKGTLQRCDVTRNKGEKYIVYQKGSLNEGPKNISFHPGFAYSSEIEIKNPTVHLTGKWSVEQTFLLHNNQIEVLTEEFYIKIKDILEEIKGSPSTGLYIYKGNYAIFKIPQVFPHLESCILVNEDKMEYNVLSKEYSHLKIQEPGVCGVHMMVNKTIYAYWTLFADVNINETYYAQIHMNVEEQNDLMEKSVLRFQLGQENSVSFSRNSATITFCQLEDPNGKKFPLQTRRCSHKIPFVTKLHEGLWKVHYGLMGSNTPFKTYISVETFDNPSLNCTVTYKKNEHINLLCRARGYPSIEYCRFTRPDNFTFSVTPGVGDERYGYYGEGYQEENSMYPERFDCGLTIRSPLKEDFGAWKCTIYLKDKTTGKILRTDNLSKLFSHQSVKTYGSKVYVPKGNSFTLKCSAGDVLNYCWMLSPNGTAYTVSKKGSSPSDLSYEGSGLEFGECGAVVEVADNTHLGEWSCRMGILNGTEVMASVSVTVTDSLLIADENTIDISYRKPTILNCRIIPGYDNAINYCRWIRPDGYGIYNIIDNQYVTEKTLSSCKLTIQELNVRFDVGSWSCVAGIAGREMMEATSQIEIKYSYMGLGGIISVALTIALLIITTITLFVIIVHKRRNRYVDEKIILAK